MSKIRKRPQEGSPFFDRSLSSKAERNWRHSSCYASPKVEKEQSLKLCIICFVLYAKLRPFVGKVNKRRFYPCELIATLSTNSVAMPLLFFGQTRVIIC
uniref:Uncharacterized protein n=1 Tax=Tupiella akineta TaxID=160070 RepID=Q6UVT9_TUPAK|nr:hypothetical protein PsakpMp23 [Tupiella akineta]AAQ18735.1 hypothetical protein [Tupiella akineta]